MKKILTFLAITTFCFASTACGSKESTPSETNNATAESEAPVSPVTPIDDFKYTLTENELTLQKCSGSDDIIYVANQYSIDGNTYNVTKLDGAMFFNSKVKTVILANGIGEISHALFNGAQIEHLYIPNSLKCIYDDSLAYISRSLTDIYFGGTEEEWNQIYTSYDAGSISENVENSNLEGAGAAAADKLNALIGHSEFDISTIEIHYNASETDLLEK